MMLRYIIEHWWAWLLGVMLLATVESAQADAEPWVLIDTQKQTLAVISGNKAVAYFDGVALGRKGAGLKHQRGDDTTPLGVFRVRWINDKSSYGLFFGLDYPNLDYADRAYQEDRIDGATYYAIRHAIKEGRTPPQNTILGGSIGIHGIGRGDPRIHEDFNWTHGCIALTNGQIYRLAKWVRIGTRVEIR